MIDGIEVFTKSEIIYPNTNFIIMFIVGLAIAIILTFLCSRFKNYDDNIIVRVIMLIIVWGLVIFSAISFLLFLFCIAPEKTGRYKYEVKIDSTVTVQELYENYNVTGYDKKNNIFIIEDK